MIRIKKSLARKNYYLALLLGLSASVGLFLYVKKKSSEIAASEVELRKALLREKLGHALRDKGDFPEKLNFDDRQIQVHYTFDNKLTEYIKSLLGRYKSDYSSIIVLDNKSGRILSAVAHSRHRKEFDKSLIFSSTHPSASLIKIITSAELLQNASVTRDTIFNYTGRGTTLYRYQLRNRKNRWTRYLSLEDAFAHSNNVIFGKAAINKVTGMGMFNMATDFGFNQDLMQEIPLGKSIFRMPHNQYNLAELASGLNRTTMMSPVHAALIPLVVANEGVLKYPRLISHIADARTGEKLWGPEGEEKRVISPKTSWNLKIMMQKTIERGTARGTFRRLKRSLRQSLDIGGKTGSITGGVPHGKRDWFVAFANPKDQQLGDGISISVMNVNVKKWYVKSTFLAKRVIEYYYRSLKDGEYSKVGRAAANSIGPTHSKSRY